MLAKDGGREMFYSGRGGCWVQAIREMWGIPNGPFKGVRELMGMGGWEYGQLKPNDTLVDEVRRSITDVRVNLGGENIQIGGAVGNRTHFSPLHGEEINGGWAAGGGRDKETESRNLSDLDFRFTGEKDHQSTQ